MAKKNAKKPAQPPQKPQTQPEPQPQIQKAPPSQSTPQPPIPKPQSTPTPPVPQSQSQSKSNPQPAQQPQKSPMAPSNRARLLWRTFETWAREQQDSMNTDLDKLSRDMDMLWRSTPKQHRDSKTDLDKRKADQRREKEGSFYEEMRAEWQKRLDDAGLRDEDWDDITEEEGLAVMKLLGGDAEVDDETVMINGMTEQVPIAPTPLSIASRSTNSSSSLDYDIVSPSMFRSDAEDGKGFDLFDITSFNDDTNSDASASNPWSWESEASGYNTVNTETPQSSSHSSPKLSPDTISLGGYVKVPAARSSQPQSVTTKTSEKKQTRYIGPVLVDHDDHPQDDEADFASFKTQMRILKIQEFHAEAAEADIELALQIVETQSKTKIHEVLAAHEQRMLLLQERKEAERKAQVEAERQKRKRAIRERSTQRVAPPARPNLFGESDKDALSPLVQQPQKETKAGRKKKSTSTKTDESPAPTPQFSQDTIRRKVVPPSDDKETDNWNPFDYDINALLATIPGSMPPPIGSSFPTPSTDAAAGSSQQNSRPAPVSRTTSSTSRINGREFWVPPTASELKQAPAPKGKIATANSHFDPPNPPTNLTAVPQDTKPITSRSSSFTRQGEPPAGSQSHSATSSKTTLEDMRPADPRSFWQPPNMIRSTSNLNLNSQPNRHEIWIPPSQDTSRARALSSASRPPETLAVPSSSSVSQIQKSQSMPQGPSETVSDTKRSRRMSDPVSPSPRSFLLPVENNSALEKNSGTGLPTKGKAGKGGGKGKRVTIEDVPDEEEEEGGHFEHLPSDSKHIMEPKPVVPPAMFEQILDYDEEVSSIPPKTSNAGWDKVMEDKAARAKHVRWTPSVVGGSPVSIAVPDDDKELPRWANGRDRKGKGRVADSGDDLSRFAKEALVGLKQMGGKAR